MFLLDEEKLSNIRNEKNENIFRHVTRQIIDSMALSVFLVIYGHLFNHHGSRREKK